MQQMYDNPQYKLSLRLLELTNPKGFKDIIYRPIVAKFKHTYLVDERNNAVRFIKATSAHRVCKNLKNAGFNVQVEDLADGTFRIKQFGILV